MFLSNLIIMKLTNMDVCLFDYWIWYLKLAGLVSDNVPCTVIGDPGRFRQVVMNLVDIYVKVSKIFKPKLFSKSCTNGNLFMI